MRLRLVQPYIYKTMGTVTGKQYVFDGFFSEVDVDDEDAKIMIEKRTNRGCCTGTEPQIIFEVVETSTKE
jgi:hypothetical protein